MGFLTRYDGEFREPLVRCQGTHVSMRMARGYIQKTKIMPSGPITSWQIEVETVETVRDNISWAPKPQQMVTAAMKLKDTYSLEDKL